MTTDELAAIRELWGQTTPGEWVYDAECGYIEVPALGSGIMRREPNWDRSTAQLFVGRTDKDRHESTHDYQDPDGEFIARAHQYIPALLAEVEALQQSSVTTVTRMVEVENDLDEEILRAEKAQAEVERLKRERDTEQANYEGISVTLCKAEAEVERLKREVNGWVRSERVGRPLPYPDAEAKP